MQERKQDTNNQDVYFIHLYYSIPFLAKINIYEPT